MSLLDQYAETRPEPEVAAHAPTTAPVPPPRPRAWRWTAGSGCALLVLVTIHMIANHFVVHETGGLRNYRQVLDYLAHPVIFVIEALLLTTVTIHAMLGIRSIVFDLDLSPRARRRIERGLWALGIVTVGYGLTLLTTLAGRA
jgi:succinate dehydrogenase hydrophobic anchor subunit